MDNETIGWGYNYYTHGKYVILNSNFNINTTSKNKLAVPILRLPKINNKSLKFKN